jgi:DNA polymerase elongation subunit (family B)
MSYIDAMYDRTKDKVRVVERINGERVLREFPARHVFYYTHPSGSVRSIFGDACKKYETTDSRKFKRELASVERNPKTTIFESDIRPAFRVLSDQYKNAPTPTLNVCFLDIETDWDPVRRWAPPEDPYHAVTAITFYLSSVQRLITLVLCPNTLSMEEADAIGSKYDDTIVFEHEDDMLTAFLDLIEDTDLFSGWNSESYDIPYLVNRIARVLGEDYTRKFCLWRQRPRAREYSRFGKLETTYDFTGRAHLDYMLLYKKHVTQQRHSYKLDFIGALEVNETKVPYEGSLDDLYKKEFPKFIEYSRQDVMLLVKLDKKLKYIDLHNQIAHANCVDFKTTMGSVLLVETAIINEMHEMGLVVPNKKAPEEEIIVNNGVLGDVVGDDEDDAAPIGHNGPPGRNPVVGAYVAKPKKGLHSFVGAIDINSLYPSVLRALNMSPETIYGQLRLTETEALIAERAAKLPKTQKAEAWEGIFHCLEYGHVIDRDAAPVTVDFESGSTREMCGWQIYDMIFKEGSNLCITANGTIFRTDKEGIIPALLARWYADRKLMQGMAKALDAISSRESRPDGFKNDTGVLEAAGHLVTELNGWFVPVDEDSVPVLQAMSKLYDQRQLARKILLNSLYGALLNVALRFYDPRVGQSVTLTGRAIAKHMNSKTNEVATGVYDHTGDAIIYADTDSCYFSVHQLLDKNPEMFGQFDRSRESYVTLYDAMAEVVNDSFAEFMHRSFNTGLARGGIIKAGRELVASRALFIKKKKYAVLIYELEGKRLDVDGKPGKLKAMGLDLKRADTPKMMQDFMSKILIDLLTIGSKDAIYDQIRQFRKDFGAMLPWQKGSPKAVNGLTAYTERVMRSRRMNAVDKRRITDEVKVNQPQQVKASINWNDLCTMYSDSYASRITDGARIIVCRLKSNAMGLESVAYPFDETYLPKWFKELPFDETAMENIIIDKKLSNLLGVLDWDLKETIERPADDVFSFFD